MKISTNLKIILSLAVSFALAFLWTTAANRSYGGQVPLETVEFTGLYTLALGAVALAMAFFTEGDLKSLHFDFPQLRFFGYALLAGLCFTVVPLICNLAFNLVPAQQKPTFDSSYMLYVFIILFVLAAAEEMMWRGFFFTTLSKKTKTITTSFIIGLLSAAWYLPLILRTKFITLGDDITWLSLPVFTYGDRPIAFVLLMFTVLCVAMSFVYTYFRLLTSSIWPGAFLHTIVNLIFFTICHPLENGAAGSQLYFKYDIGVFYVIVAVIGAALLVPQYKKITASKKKKKRKHRSSSSSSSSGNTRPETAV